MVGTVGTKIAANRVAATQKPSPATRFWLPATRFFAPVTRSFFYINLFNKITSTHKINNRIDHAGVAESDMRCPAHIYRLTTVATYLEWFRLSRNALRQAARFPYWNCQKLITALQILKTKMPARLPDTTELRRLYKTEGLTLRQIAERFGVTHQAVHDRLINAGIKLRPRVGPRPTLKRAELYKVYVVEGLNIRATARRLGSNAEIVGRELTRHRIKRRTVWERKSHRLERKLLVQLYLKDGLTQIETAERLGVKVRIVKSELRRHRITYRQKGGRKSKRDRFTFDQLNKLYNGELLSPAQIGERLGVSESITRYELNRHGIKLRSRKSA